MSKKTTVLMILDGYGLNEKKNINKIAKELSKTQSIILSKLKEIKITQKN